MNLVLYVGAVFGSINYLGSFSIGWIKSNCKKDKFAKKDIRNKNMIKLVRKQRSVNNASSPTENNFLGNGNGCGVGVNNNSISPKASSFIPFVQDN